MYLHLLDHRNHQSLFHGVAQSTLQYWIWRGLINYRQKCMFGFFLLSPISRLLTLVAVHHSSSVHPQHHYSSSANSFHPKPHHTSPGHSLHSNPLPKKNGYSSTTPRSYYSRYSQKSNSKNPISSTRYTSYNKPSYSKHSSFGKSSNKQNPYKSTARPKYSYSKNTNNGKTYSSKLKSSYSNYAGKSC